MTDYMELYKTEPRFHRYVDACAKADEITVEEELAKQIIRNVGDYYARTPMNETEKKSTSTMSGGSC